MTTLLESFGMSLLVTAVAVLAGCGEITASAGGSGGGVGAGATDGSSGGMGGGTGTTFPCTEEGIRDAIAEGGGPHTFDCDGPTPMVTAVEIEIDNDVVLDGEGNLTLDGNDMHRVLSVASGVTASLRGFTVTRGYDGPDPKSVRSGAGIHNSGTLALTHCTVSRNTIDWGSGGGIRNTGTLALVGTTVSDNSALSPGSEGGGILNSGTLTVTNSTVSGNTSGFFEELCSGDGIANYGTFALVSSTVSGDAGPNCLVLNEGTFAVASSIIDGACEGDITSNGYNIESPGDTCGFIRNSVSAEDLKLGPLADNGGPTMTHALLPGSIATNVIPGTECTVDQDQRGVVRPQGVACDLGAFELKLPFPCTEAGIRDAIAAGGGLQTFDCAGPTTVTTQATIVIDNDVILDGRGELTVDGGGEHERKDENHRVFSVARGAAVELRGLTITGGFVEGTANVEDAGGAVRNDGALRLVGVVVSGNGVFDAVRSPGVGGVANLGEMEIVGSTIAENRPGNFNNGTLALVNSTVEDDFANVGTLSLLSSTWEGTLADRTGTVTMKNTLFVGECEGDVDDRSLEVTSLGYNIESPGDNCGFNQTTDQVDVRAGDLKLGPLQDNGGPTETHALGAGSVAIDLIPVAMCEVDEDQRGEPRPGGSMCDVGAFEAQEGEP